MSDTHGRGKGRTGIWGAVGWAFYLACSWTWCIGMFMPTLLVRDYGTWGFVVFALPNVLGAAAMGWVIVSSRQAETILRRHAHVVALFAGVTVAFHLFFLQWLGAMIPGLWWMGAVASVPVAGVLALRSSQGSLRWIALAFWAFSALVAAALLAERGDGAGWTIPATSGGTGLLFLAPVCLFGFALCPYLDPTFLRARASLREHSASQMAFGLGFVVLFFAMILLTLLYAPIFPGRAGEPVFNAMLLGGISIGLLVAHFTAQALFTSALHLKEGLPLNPPLMMVVPLLGFLAGLPVFHGWDVHDMPSHEVVYRVFMSFYGLVFPGYVWLCMIPTRDGHSGLGGARGRAKLRVWCAAVGIAAPSYWMGFIALDEVFLLVGLAIMLGARFLVRRPIWGRA